MASNSINCELLELQESYKNGDLGPVATRLALMVIASGMAVAVRGEGAIRMAEKIASDVMLEWNNDN